jgi:hypothetical protein
LERDRWELCSTEKCSGQFSVPLIKKAFFKHFIIQWIKFSISDAQKTLQHFLAHVVVNCDIFLQECLGDGFIRQMQNYENSPTMITHNGIPSSSYILSKYTVTSIFLYNNHTCKIWTMFCNFSEWAILQKKQRGKTSVSSFVKQFLRRYFIKISKFMWGDKPFQCKYMLQVLSNHRI